MTPFLINNRFPKQLNNHTAGPGTSLLLFLNRKDGLISGYQITPPPPRVSQGRLLAELQKDKMSRDPKFGKKIYCQAQLKLGLALISISLHPPTTHPHPGKVVLGLTKPS
jgi:hypothetical protein